jgi:AcrR family transcriptional regulator
MTTADPDPSPASAGARRRLRADDWAQAALRALGDGGLAAVAVEPIAARLGATKGSFYWHFANREALIEAALQLWERQHTDAVIAELESEPDPAARLRRLFTLVIGISRHDAIEVALLATADDPLVAPLVQRATHRRIAYVASVYEELGLAPAAAGRRAVHAVSVYLGHVQLARAAPRSLPADAEAWERHLDEIITALLP